MRPRHLAPLALLLLALAPAAARAYTYGDTLTVIWRPLPNLPAFARPGDSFTVWANAPSSAANWSATLRYGALQVALIPSGGGWQPTKGRWELSFTVPPGTPEEVYALRLLSDSTPVDEALHAVKVLPAYRTDYYFAQISDTHVPEHTFSSSGSFNPADTTGLADFNGVIEDLNVIHPEFIIHTGDLVNEGELEEYLAMYEMGRAQAMLNRLHDPVWVSSGNHDIGGWIPTAPPDGTSRLNWWRYFGWRFLGNPPAGDPYHSQNFTFDYGPLHVIGLEAYINSGSYDHYEQNTWGAQSFTPEQIGWLKADIAAQPPGTKKLLFYHYDFGGTLANGNPGPQFAQINVDSLQVDGAIWGHNHVVAEDRNRTRSARPFDLGCRSVIDYRAFRIFRVSDGVMTPGPMHFAQSLGATKTDSMGVTWNGANDGTRSANTVTIVNRYGETWDHARILFNMADHDSTFTATGGTIAQVVRQSGMANVTVDTTVPASGTLIASVQASAPIVTGVPAAGPAAFRLGAITPNPFEAGSSMPLEVRFTLPEAADARLEVFDVTGRRVATLARGRQSAGEHTVRWDGRADAGGEAPPAVYLVRLASGAEMRIGRFVLTR